MNEQLEQLESQLEELPLLHKIALYISILILLSGASWYLYGESMSEEIESKESSIAALQKREKLQNTLIPSLQKKSQNLKEEILKLKEKSSEVTQKINFVQTKLEELRFVFFDGKETAQILDKILKKSLQQSINIEMIKIVSQDAQSDTFIIAKDSISIIGSGSYADILVLIQYIDSLKSLLKLTKISLSVEEDTTMFELNILHHGVEL